MTWAEAEIGGYESFGRFDRIVVTPPQFPDRQGEHRRAQMIRALIRRLAGGAHAVFLLPPVVEGGVGSPSLFHRAEDLLREVTGARLEDRLDPNAVPLVFDPAAPRRLRRYLARHSPDVVVRVPADPLGFGPLVAHTVLAGFAHLDEDPCAVVGFPGNGAWLVLPWRPNGGEDDALVDVLALLDDAGDLRSAHDRAQATPLRGANGGRAQRLLDRPTPGSKIGKLLARFERAEGKFIVISREEDNNVLPVLHQTLRSI